VRTLFADAKMEALISPPAPAVVVPAPAAAATPSGPP
jgi:hypothetical protein